MVTYTYMNELGELKDILDDIEYNDIPSSTFDDMTEDEKVDIINTIIQLMHDYVIENPEQIHEADFHDKMLESIDELITESTCNFSDGYDETESENIMLELVDVAVDMFYLQIMPKRSYHANYFGKIPPSNSNKNISTILKNLKTIPQPEQRTMEWYLYRHELITASNAFKIFDTQSVQNQLIFEKCKPLTSEMINTKNESKGTPLIHYDTLDIVKNATKLEDIKTVTEELSLVVNISSPLHWGQKYEPVTTMYYDFINNTSVSEYGCIRHPKYSFIGASPDGIVDDVNHEKYGRMVEIKNIVNREITGIPLKAYWVQMQLQMEVCDLDTCDFVETRFKEYSDKDSFNADGDFNNTLCGKFKGIMLCFVNKQHMPVYEYKPFTMGEKEYNEQWLPKILIKHAELGNYHVHTYYWWLEEISCVLVVRNRLWFELNIGAITKFWDTIVKERITGYSHRAPAKQIAKQKSDILFQKCMLTLNEDENENEEVLENNIINTNITDKSISPVTNDKDVSDKIKPPIINVSAPEPRTPPMIMHIRTESIDETSV